MYELFIFLSYFSQNSSTVSIILSEIEWAIHFILKLAQLPSNGDRTWYADWNNIR